jgi:16S rRNA (cytidine1402-2'-O)-methyltransferase
MPRERRASAKKAERTGQTRATSVAVSNTGDEPSHGSGRSKPPAGLYIVATPIGNLEDITLRALATLKSVDAVACEDTRVTAKLFARHGVRAPLVAYHEHNAERMRPLLLDRVRRGEAVALVSDAGTPLVSDPGFKLVRAAIDEGLLVTTLPGASAALAGLVLSGLPSDRFFFAGFLPAKEGARRHALAEVASVPATLVFFESAARLAAALADMAATLGDRRAAVARELTKLYEEVRRGSLQELGRHYAETGAPRGEVVVVVAPADPQAAAMSDESLDGALKEALAAMSLKDASVAVAAATGLPRRVVYARALALAGRAK